jgi:hypothetical protein
VLHVTTGESLPGAEKKSSQIKTKSASTELKIGLSRLTVILFLEFPFHISLVKLLESLVF